MLSRLLIARNAFRLSRRSGRAVTLKVPNASANRVVTGHMPKLDKSNTNRHAIHEQKHALLSIQDAKTVLNEYRVKIDYTAKRFLATETRKARALAAYRDHFGKTPSDEHTLAEIETLMAFNKQLESLPKKLEGIECWITHHWDGGSQNIFVRNLSVYLKACGFTVKSDQEDKHSAILEKFMNEFGVIHAKKVILVICTPGYVQRLQNKNSGVYKEFQRVKEWLGTPERVRVIPLLVEADKKDNSNEIDTTSAIPPELAQFKYINFILTDVRKDKSDNLNDVLELVKRIQAQYEYDGDAQEIKTVIHTFPDERRRIFASRFIYDFAPGCCLLATRKSIDDNFFKLIAAVNNLLPPPVAHKEDHKTIRYSGLMPKYKYFYGRGNDLSRMRKIFAKNPICYLKDNKDNKGGKTFLANQFAYEQIDHGFEYVYWIDGKNLKSIKNDFLRILKLPIPLHDNADEYDNVMVFQEFQESIGNKKKVFLIFDNVENIDHIRELVSHIKDKTNIYCLIILSNNCQKTDDDKTCLIDNDPYWAKGCVHLMFPELAETKNQELGERFVNNFEGFPLVLYQVTNFILHEAEYRKKDKLVLIDKVNNDFPKFYIEAGKIKQKAHGTFNDLTKLILTNYLFVMDYYKDLSSDKSSGLDHRLLRSILNFCSLIGCERIPRKLITNWIGQRNGATNKAIDILIEIKLFDVDRADNDNFFVVYKLTQEAILYNLISVGWENYQHLYFVENWFNIAIRVLLDNIGKIDDSELYYHVEALIHKLTNPKECSLPVALETISVDRYNLAILRIRLAEYSAKTKSNDSKIHEGSIEKASILAVDICMNVNNFWIKNGMGSRVQSQVPQNHVCPIQPSEKRYGK